MNKNRDLQDFDAESRVSATFYLSKFQEFSENVLTRDGLGHEVELEKSLHFISEILRADAVVLAEIVSDRSAGMLKAVTNGSNISRSLEEEQINILINLFDDVCSFDADDDGAREVAGFLFDEIIPMSGFSVPVKVETGLRGILSVYYTSNVPTTESKILFLKSMASVMSHIQQSRDLLSQVDIKHAKLVFDAKREWEGTVDSLEQLIIVLDENAKVIRANKAIQYWEMDGLDAVIGSHIDTVITRMTGNTITSIFPAWVEIWGDLAKYQHIEWMSEVKNAQILRFSLRKIIDNSLRNKENHHGFAVLFVEDITKSKDTEKQLQNYANRLENKLHKRNAELERVNALLRIELYEQKQIRSALVKSEEKYHTLFNSSLSGICQLDDGRISFYNNRFLEIFRYPKATLHGMHFSVLVAEEDRAELQIQISEILENPESSSVRIVRAHNAFGENLWLEICLGLIILQDKKNVIVNVVDITRLKNIEISLRESEERLQKLSGQLINAQETERKRIALELHDSLGQSLSAIKYMLEGLSRKINCRLEVDCARDVEDIIGRMRETVEETRNMSMELRPSMLDDLGILSTINWFCRQFQETYKHILIIKNIGVNEHDIEESCKIAIYRVIQEAMNNTAKHSKADRIELSLQILDQEYIQLLIQDNGSGIKDLDTQLVSYNTMGLSGMKERVELTGGRFVLMNKEPNGVRIDIRWPSTLNRGYI